MERIYSIEDYEEVESLIPEQVIQVRSKLKEKYSIAIPENCDKFLGRCLRMKDGNMEKAISLIKAFYAATAGFQKWEATFQPSLHRYFYNSGALTPMLQRDPSGRHILVLRTGLWDTEKMNFDQAIACIWMLLQYMTVQSKDAQRHGFVTVFDYSHFSMQHVLAINKWRLPYIAKIIQNGVCGRIKTFHIINHPRVISAIYAGLKPFLKEKLRRRVIFHNDLDSLFSHMDQDILPTSVGGTLEQEECRDTALMSAFLEQDDYFSDTMNDRFPNK